MEDTEENGMRKKKLAVFEHVVQNEKPSKRRKLIRSNSEDSSQLELIINDTITPIKRKKKSLLIKLSKEPLNLECKWNSCNQIFDSWDNFNAHVTHHATHSSGEFCQWTNCDVDEFDSETLLTQHMSYHAYLAKLKNIGDNVAKREKLPKCIESHTCELPLKKAGYTCEWIYCSFICHTIFEFLNHMNVHIKNNPNNAKKKDVIECCWNSCNTKYSTQQKLADHLKTHTKEKIMGCSNCNRLFSNKTKFCDHRKRQKTELSSALQTYQCSQCLKLFPTERLLRDHIRSHVNNYKCTMCDMTCSKPSVLAKHIRFKHINFKPYKCPECNKRFVEKYNLNTHLKIHKEENPLKCTVCNFKCRTKVGMDNHYVKSHDSEGLVYECHCCEKKFKRGTYLTKHLTKHHDYRWPSGHSRFRYRKDEDGIYRLQTVRYESLEVTKDLIRSESMQASTMKKAPAYNLRYENSESGYTVHITHNVEPQPAEDTAKKEKSAKNVLITINDVDDKGNILKCEVMESKLVPMHELPNLDDLVSVKSSVTKQEDVISDVELTLKAEKDESGNKKQTILDYEIFKNTRSSF